MRLPHADHKEKILGECKYTMVNPDQAIARIMLKMPSDDYWKYKVGHNQAIMIVIDKSGSMSGSPMLIVKKCAINFANAFELNPYKDRIQFMAIPFNHYSDILRYENTE